MRRARRVGASCRTRRPRTPGRCATVPGSRGRLGASPLYGCGDLHVAHHSEFLPHAILNGLADRRIFLEELLGVLAPLTKTLPAEGEPRTTLLDDPLFDSQVEQIAFARDAFAVHHVEFRLAEGRRHLVLHHLHPRAASDDLVAVLDAGNAADIDPDRRVELERAAAGGRLRIAEHD